MAAQGQFEATAKRHTGQGRHHRLRTAVDDRDDVAQHGRFKLQRRAELGHVGAGREGFVSADEHDRRHVRIGLGGADRFDDEPAQGDAQAVDGRGVEFNTCDAECVRGWLGHWFRS
ncbi:hypothetical protein D9M68_918030 [compost metagenome]